MLPGIGIFGSDPIADVLVELLSHFHFEVHAIWTNQCDLDDSKHEKHKFKYERFPKLIITSSMDNVLLNKNVNLVFICCQPNLHAQISTKALGIGKNVICLFPTCKSLDEIGHMINSAYYYPSLMSSISYGGLKYLSEFKLIKQYLKMVGDIKCCNITVNCRNIAQVHEYSNDFLESSTNSSNWLGDRDLGAGVLNRFGAALISLILHLFENKKVTKVFGCLKTFEENVHLPNKTKPTSFDSSSDNEIKKLFNNKHFSHIRKITADDHCTFQLNLEPNSILVNVIINSLAQSNYSQEILIAGSHGVILCKDSDVFYRTSIVEQINIVNQEQQSSFLLNSNESSSYQSKLDRNNNHVIEDTKASFYETQLHLNESIDINLINYLNSFKNIEKTYPELPLVFIRGLYYYLLDVKREYNEIKSKQTPANKSLLTRSNLDDFEHTRIVQLIIKNINLSSDSNRWFSVNY
jgi:predicted dehydrogenase